MSGDVLAVIVAVFYAVSFALGYVHGLEAHDAPGKPARVSAYRQREGGRR